MDHRTDAAPSRLTHALVLNALLFPGSGHCAIGLRREGIALMAAATAFLLWPLVRYTAAVLIPLHGASHGATPMVRTLEVMSSAWAQTRGTVFFCIAALLITWIYGIVEIAVRMRRPPGGFR